MLGGNLSSNFDSPPFGLKVLLHKVKWLEPLNYLKLPIILTGALVVESFNYISFKIVWPFNIIYDNPGPDMIFLAQANMYYRLSR